MSNRAYERVGSAYAQQTAGSAPINKRQMYLNMSEQQLRYMFRSENWPKDQYEKEWILQGMENRIAEREGRAPCSVLTFEQEYDPGKGILRGEHSGNAIFVNVNEGLNQYSILKTLLHEDEHDEQESRSKQFLNDPDYAVANSKFSKHELESFVTEMQGGSYVEPNEGPGDRNLPIERFGGKSLDEQINASENGYYGPYCGLNCELDAESRSMDYMTSEEMYEMASDDPAYKEFINDEQQSYNDRKKWLENNPDVKKDVQRFQVENDEFLTDEQKNEFENNINNAEFEEPSVEKYRETTDRLNNIRDRLNGEEQSSEEETAQDEDIEFLDQNDEESIRPAAIDSEDENLEIFNPYEGSNETELRSDEDEDLEIFDPSVESNRDNQQNDEDEDLEMFESADAADVRKEDPETEADALVDEDKNNGRNNSPNESVESEASELVSERPSSNETASDYSKENPEEESAEDLVGDSSEEKSEDESRDGISHETESEGETEDNASELTDSPESSESESASEAPTESGESSEESSSPSKGNSQEVSM